jgi:transposase
VINELDTYTKEQLISELIITKSNLDLLKAELAQLKRMIFGSKSERFVPSATLQQSSLFGMDVATVEATAVVSKEISYTREVAIVVENKHKGRLPLPAHLPRVEHVLEPTEDTTGLVRIGEEITEELEYTPGKFFVNKYTRPKYAKADKQGVLIADLPVRPIEKCIAGVGLLTQILIEKYLDHLPLYRQVARFKRVGVPIPESTIGDWVKQSCILLTPLYEALKKQVLNAHYLMADETPIQVLDKEKKGSTHRGYYWVYRDVESKIILFDYQTGRGRDGPTTVLKNYTGFLQTDGYHVYDAFDKKEGITLLHCMAHARRYFEHALDNDRVRAEYFLYQIKLLYDIERKAREQNCTHQERLQLRQQESLPILVHLHQWLKDNLNKVLPKSSIGKAVAYALARWDKLSIYAHHGHLQIDNNPVENAIRPVAIGRKNYLFAGSHEAAQRAAMVYSLLATCKANNIEPYEWLKNILTILPSYKTNQLHLLIPT